MAHFCKIDENNIVTQVIVVSNDDCGGGDFPSSESIGQVFIASIGLDGTWKQTSYNRNFRKQYGMIGYIYDPIADVFIEPQPYPSWILDSNFDWQPPVDRPEGYYVWDENIKNWMEV